jgi:hypothetical protein
MSNAFLDKRFRELAWRRKLKPAEEVELLAWLADHPEERDAWETEARLNEALARLPDAAVPSNFTTRVLESIEREGEMSIRRKLPQGWLMRTWRGWLPKVGFAALLATAGFFSVHHFLRHPGQPLLKGLVAVSQVGPSAPDILTNFDVICALDRIPPPDEDLLKLFQ